MIHYGQQERFRKHDLRYGDGEISPAHLFNISLNQANSRQESKDFIRQRNIHCVTKRDSIQVYPIRIVDYRALTKILNEASHEYRTFRVPETNC